MTVGQLLEKVSKAGLTLRLTDTGGINARPADRITPAMRDLLKAHKTDLVAALRQAEHGGTMSLRQKLLDRAKVAGCVYQQTQHRNFPETSATDTATTAQLSAANPHEIRVLSATDTATAPQLRSCAGAQNHPSKVALVAPSCAAVAAPFDDRVVCLTCRHLANARSCRNWRAAGLSSAAVGPDLQRLPQRCPAHRPAAPTPKTEP